jgi:hypothetical protein
MDARATGLTATIRSFDEMKWNRILDGARAFADARRKGAGAAPPPAHMSVEVEEPFLLSDGESDYGEPNPLDCADGEDEVPEDEAKSLRGEDEEAGVRDEHY